MSEHGYFQAGRLQPDGRSVVHVEGYAHRDWQSCSCGICRALRTAVGQAVAELESGAQRFIGSGSLGGTGSYVTVRRLPTSAWY